MVVRAAHEITILDIDVGIKEEKLMYCFEISKLTCYSNIILSARPTSNMYNERDSGPSVQTLELLYYILIQMTTVTKNSEHHPHCFGDLQYMFHQLLETKFGLGIFIRKTIASGMSTMPDVD